METQNNTIKVVNRLCNVCIITMNKETRMNIAFIMQNIAMKK